MDPLEGIIMVLVNCLCYVEILEFFFSLFLTF